MSAKDLGAILGQIVQSPPPAGTAVVAPRRMERDRTCLAVNAVPVAPTLDAAMEMAIQAWRLPHPDFGYEKSVATVAVIEGAKTALLYLERRNRPATVEDWSQFLFPLAGNNTRGAPAGNSFDQVVMDIASGMGQVPVCLLTKASLEEAFERFEWFPTVFQLKKWLKPLIVAAEREQAAVARLAKAEPPPPPRPPLTRAEIEGRKAMASARIRHQAALRLADEEAARAAATTRLQASAARTAERVSPEQQAALREEGIKARGGVPLPPKLPWPKPDELARIQAAAAAKVDLIPPPTKETE